MVRISHHQPHAAKHTIDGDSKDAPLTASNGLTAPPLHNYFRDWPTIYLQQPGLSTRHPVNYPDPDTLGNGDALEEYEAWQSTDSDEAEDERIQRSMGVIRETSRNHDPRTHAYRVVEQNSIPIYDKDWGADEELLLIEGLEMYGLGSWADVADHVGGFRTKDECRDHYIQTYINSSQFPLPELADPSDKRLLESVPKEEFQARKKRRIEERKEAAKTAPPTTPKQKPTASVPACHEVQGFMPGRLEFESEFANEAEEAVQHMQFEPGDGLDANGQMDEETLLKMTVFDIYNSRLADRSNRKRVIFEHGLLDYRKNSALDKKRTKEERDMFNKCKPFAQLMNHEDFKKFSDDIIYEHNLRVAIGQLQGWRNAGIADLREGEKYEQEKMARIQRNQPQGQFDRMASSLGSRQKPGVKDIPETPSEAQKLVSAILPIRFQNKSKDAPPEPAVPNEFDKMFAETNGGLSPPHNISKPKVKYTISPLPGVTPWKLEKGEPLMPDVQLLSPEEVQLCNVLHFSPKSYNAMKLALLQEAFQHSGTIKKKDAKSLLKIDSAPDGVPSSYQTKQLALALTLALVESNNDAHEPNTPDPARSEMSDVNVHTGGAEIGKDHYSIITRVVEG
ncbi:MAG: hypothetical protein Q9227_007203 [Pyrenula ochraceoflavens]